MWGLPIFTYFKGDKNVIKGDIDISKISKNRGLRCMKCIYPEGYFSGNFEEDSSVKPSGNTAKNNDWECSEEPSHVINYKDALKETINNSKSFVLRRYASAVSKLINLH